MHENDDNLKRSRNLCILYQPQPECTTVTVYKNTKNIEASPGLKDET